MSGTANEEKEAAAVIAQRASRCEREHGTMDAAYRREGVTCAYCAAPDRVNIMPYDLYRIATYCGVTLEAALNRYCRHEPIAESTSA